MKGPADSAIRIGRPFSTLNPEQGDRIELLGGFVDKVSWTELAL
jgi:hypothetical protein